jgi:poly(3-hydroxybutyrate) depolymerase
MKYHILIIFILLTAPFTTSVSAQEITKELITSGGRTRVYYLFVPDKLTAATPAPLIVLLHGSGRNGLSLAEKWKDLAKKEKIILAGPDAVDTNVWRMSVDGPNFIHQLVEELKAKYPINARRVYLFGHSAGAGQSLYLSLMESEYFAAAAVHAGALREDAFGLIDEAKRKIPIAMFIGMDDKLVPLSAVRATRDALKERGFAPELTEIKGHTHWYYDRASEINRSAWDFLKKYELPGEPKFEPY